MSKEKDKSFPPEPRERSRDVETKPQDQHHNSVSRESFISQTYRRGGSSSNSRGRNPRGGARSKGRPHKENEPRYSCPQGGNQEQEDPASFNGSRKTSEGNVSHSKHQKRRGNSSNGHRENFSKNPRTRRPLIQDRNSYRSAKSYDELPSSNSNYETESYVNNGEKMSGQFQNDEKVMSMKTSKSDQKMSAGRVVDGKYVRSELPNDKMDHRAKQRDRNSYWTNENRDGTGRHNELHNDRVGQKSANRDGNSHRTNDRRDGTGLHNDRMDQRSASRDRKTHCHMTNDRRDGTGFFKKNNFNIQNLPSLRPARNDLPIDSEQARMLTDQLIEESYECMVCCDRIRSSQPLWSCQNCYHLFHLKCIKQWAGSEAASVKGENNGWRCPACQNVTDRMPFKYTCFCGKVTNPDWNPRDGVTPHSCGELCWKTRKNPPCSHTCNELCHPGPCPSCPVMVLKECYCGKTSTKVRCGHTKTMKCDNVCERMLNCKKHKCTLLCHEGPCDECSIVNVQECFCGKEKRGRKCGDGLGSAISDSNGVEKYSCEELCSKTLDCGNHTCNDKCHGGDCVSCPYLPKNIKYCPCKQTLISDLLPAGQERQSCLDPIPCCNSFCGKKLPCGSKGQSHLCKRSCHIGNCGPCEGIMMTSCRCGSTEIEIPCKEYDPDKEFTCERRCNKKRSCGRHRCNQKCCVCMNHNCNLICGRKLTCGLHKCDEVCHPGNCPRCWQTSFDERFCYCGKTVQYPPIPCGTPLPECNNPCTRPHPCGHEPKHNCHNEDACPPCVVLVEKRCLCNRETRKNVPCHINNVSCGKPCGKELKCGQHKCLKICHKGECLAHNEHCQQPCVISRRDCPHPCGAPCHIGQDCPEGPCKSQITVKCRCRRKSEKVLCLAGNAKVQFQRFATDSVGDKLRNLRSGQSVDISGLMIAEKRGGLDCDEDCAVIERNKKLAEALGIENPDGSHFLSLPFSYSLKEEAKKQLPLVKIIEEAIEALIHKIQKNPQTSLVQLSHSFQPMNSTQRKLVHELAEHYNCKTISYDQEPKRNTVVTVTRDSCLVVPKLSTVLERKSKPLPQPVLNLQEKPLNFQRMQKKSSQDDLTGAKASAEVDYFGDDFLE